MPITGHTHVTDARVHDDGSRDLLLLGQGELDTIGLCAGHARGRLETTS